jgi:pyrroline-5-carboxylate reductase
MAAVVPPYARAGSASAVFVSIAAGTTLAAIRAGLGAGAAVVRAMPNTPAQIRQGVTVACAGAGVSPEQRALADRLLAAVGEVAWVDDEALLDAVTAVSGSGPAYVFLLAECLAEAAVAAGLPAGLAERLARRTVAGAGALLAHGSDSAALLRQKVTSPGGTTAAALAILDGANGLRPLLARAVAAAAVRARELGCPPAVTPHHPD